ncbi:hypothetical protein GCM10010199_63940 [Dactylosporangium roseum]
MITIAAVIIAVLIGGQGQALAAAGFVKPFEDDISTITYETGGEYCTEQWNVVPEVGYIMTAKGCFTRHGDVWRVQDGFAEGGQTFIYWENWLWNGSSWQPFRHGWCNNDLGAPHWGTCNKDYYESSSANYYNHKGSKIRFQVCRRYVVANSCNPGSIEEAPWINNNV